MRLPFKQGIVQAQPLFLSWDDSSITISTTNKPVIITISHGLTNYLHIEPKTQAPVVKWVNLPTQSGADFWLYWDIDLVTTRVTYGHTIYAPIVSLADPSGPTTMIDQHWYDLSQQVMKVWNGVRWVIRLRLFASRVIGGSNITLYPMGTQVGLNTPIVAGKIMRDSTGHAVKKSDNTFITTEDKFFIDNSDVRISNLEQDVILGKAMENIPGYSVVKMTQFNEFMLANYEDTGSTFLGIVLDDAVYGDSIFIAVHGIITNGNWNWTTPNQKLWLDTFGQLTSVNPGIANPTRGSQDAIARVISPDSVLFGQGLFNDVITDGSAPPPDVSGKVNRVGDTMTGPLLLNDNPTLPLHAVTKQYVDTGLVLKSDATHVHPYVNTSGDTMTGLLVLSGDPTVPLHAATKQYVDTGLGLKSDTTHIHPYVNTSGDTMTGLLVLSADPTTPLQAATKQYVDTGLGLKSDTTHNHDLVYANITHNHDAAYVNTAGDTMTGPLTLSADPTVPLHAASKQYVDAGLAAIPQGGGGFIFQIGESSEHMHYATLTEAQAKDLISSTVPNVSITSNEVNGHIHVVTVSLDFYTSQFIIDDITNNTNDNHIAQPLNGFSVDLNHTWTRAQRGRFHPIDVEEDPYGNPIYLVIDLNRSNNFNILLNNDIVLDTPLDAVAGQSGILEFNQPEDPYGNGLNGDVDFGSFWRFPDGTTPSITLTPESTDLVSYMVHSSGTFAMCAIMNDFKAGSSNGT